MPRMSIKRQKPATQHFTSRKQAVAHYTPPPQPAAATPPSAAKPPSPSVNRYNVHVSARPPHLPDFTGTPGMVVLAGGTLFIAATWGDFWKPFFSSWGSDAATPLKTNIDGRLVIGGIFFLILIAIMASISEEAGGVMVLMFLAMWLVFIIFKGGQVPQGSPKGTKSQLQNFFDWFSSGTPAPAPPKQSPAPTQVPTGKPTRIS